MGGAESFRRTFSSLSIRNFRVYFIAQAISLSGTWMQTIAQSWLVLQITGSGTALGLVTALQFLPMLVLGGLAFALGVVNAVDNPARQTFVLEMVGHEQLANAVSLNSVLVNLARVIGPALAGVLIAGAGLAPCFFVNAASYVGVLVGLRMMRAGDLHPAPLVARTAGQLRQGLRYVRSTPVVRSVLLMMALIGTLSYEFQVTLPLFAQFTLGGGAGTYAALTAAMGAGSVVGGLYTASRARVVPGMVTNAALLFGMVLLLAAITPNREWALAAMVLVGVFSISFLSLGNTTLQLESAPEMRGRVMGLWSVAFLGSTPIGGPIVGWIGEHAGPRWGLGVGGLAALVAGAFGWRSLGAPRAVAWAEA